MTYHTFSISIDDQIPVMKQYDRIKRQWEIAIKAYRERWDRTPSAVSARVGTPVPPCEPMMIDRDQRLPLNYWYFEVTP